MLPKASVKSPVMYIALVNAQDQPIYMKNFSDKKHDELQIQLLIYSSLDLIQAQSKSIEVLTQIHTYVQVDRKLAANKDSSSFVGKHCLASESDYSILVGKVTSRAHSSLRSTQTCMDISQRQN
eukprot:TRINITY_DN6209_c0_g1_i6.p2 TRINITY_DN6209_c0_g1~~TRINITY_DN6209_c0_g1_i6.p2  ORF type:complete len:124 (-),score=12.38 TRINITY_DN6209_c0_g1_i6:368-739(-)